MIAARPGRGPGTVRAYPWWHATRAELLLRLGQPGQARQAYQRALALDLSEPVARLLLTRLAAAEAGADDRCL